MIKLLNILKEEVSGDKLYLYHRTKAKYAKQILQNNFILTPNNGRAGNGTYFVYDTPTEIKSGMDAYGGVSLRYSIPLNSLNKFLVFDRELQTRSLEEQLAPISDQINNFQEYINSYNEGKLKQLSFIEMIRRTLGDNALTDNFNGILYSTKGDSYSRILMTGTNKTAVVYNQSLLAFESISTDGINYKKISNPESETKDALKSPEYLLKRNQVPANSTIKKSFIKLTGARNLQLPAGLKIVGSLDLRNIPDLVIPDDLEVTNSIYVSSGINIPDAVRAKAKKVNVY
jgi:hypothetical protein